jgi:hypothetical protein
LPYLFTYVRDDIIIQRLSVTEYIQIMTPVPVVATSEPVLVSILLAAVELLLSLVIVIFCDVEL